MLQIKKLVSSTNDKQIITDLSLAVHPGSVHAIMGPNGSGKSTLALSLMGHPAYNVEGSVIVHNQELLDLSPDKRAKLGLFVSMQYPPAIPGVTVFSFLKESYGAVHDAIDVIDLKAKFSEYLSIIDMPLSFLERSFNDGFSGGERKRLELLQLMLLKPRYAMLDEIDSGVDVDAIKAIAKGIAYARKENPAMSIILITHYSHLFKYIMPDIIHIMHDGNLRQSGDHTLAAVIEEKGYDVLSR